MTAPARWTRDQMVELAARGVGKVDRDGVRGATLVSMEETLAMAAMLVLLGLRPIPPGAPAPVPMQCFDFGEAELHPEKEKDDA